MRANNLEGRAFLLLVAVATIAFLWLVRGFLIAVFWAAVLAVVFRPLFKRCLKLVRGHTSIAALLTTLAIIVVLVVPLGLLATVVAQQSIDLYQRVATGEVDLHAPIDLFERSIPALSDLLAENGVDVGQVRASIERTAITASRWLAAQALVIGRGTVRFTILFVLTLYLLFFFVRDWQRIIDGIIRAVPLGDARERRLFAKFAEVSRATIKGTLVVAIVQGVLGGVIFALLGIEAAALWGVAMGLLSFLPAIGPPIVWIPAAVMLIATGSVARGVILIVAGTVVIGLVDNVLRPILVGRDTKMPDYLVLLSTLGGLAAFGLAGVVIGPLVAALFLVVWEMLAEEYAA